MATKTITIDLDAYNLLKAVQKDTESFSQLIKRVVTKPLDMQQFRKRLSSHPLSEEAAQAIETQVQNRQIPSRRTR